MTNNDNIKDGKTLWLPPSTKADSTAVVCRSIIWVGLLMLASMWLFEYPPLAASTGRTFTTTVLVMVGMVLAAAGIWWGSQGPRWPSKQPPWRRIVSAILGTSPNNAKPQVWYRATKVQPGYEAVAEAFGQTLQGGKESGMQFAAYVRGELVVDLVGGIAASRDEDLSLDSDTYSLLWSSSKCVTSLVMAWLVDHGHLDYNAMIRDYWPEFKGGNKDDITVAQLLKHNAGLHVAPPQKIHAPDLWPENLPKGRASKVIEGMTAWVRPKENKQLTYHAVTRGWILNEIAQRVDPQHRTIGAILREEFTTPLGVHEECYLGLPAHLCPVQGSDGKMTKTTTSNQWHRVDPSPYLLWVICNSVCQWLGIPTTTHWSFSLVASVFVTHAALLWTTFVDLYNPHRLSCYEFCNTPEYLQGESPSANLVSSARALAAIGNTLCSRNDKIFPHANDTLQKMAAGKETRCFVLDSSCTFNSGGLGVFYGHQEKAFPKSPGLPYAWGWGGYNGSLLVFHPQGDYVVAFQPLAHNEPDATVRIQAICTALVECCQKLHGPNIGSYTEQRYRNSG